MFVLGIADLANIVAEFAGLASGMGLFGISKYIVVPAGALLVWVVVVGNSYKPVERLLVLFSLIYFAYPVSAILAHPN
jgi:Mn2+/Fe2+ NRAMP family transporter